MGAPTSDQTELEDYKLGNTTSGTLSKPPVRRFFRPLVWSVLVAIAIYATTVIATDLDAVGDSAAKLGVQGWLVILGLSLLNYGLRFIRWQSYLHRFQRKISTCRSLAYYIGGFAFTTTPGKAGEALRSVYLKRHGIAYAHSLAALCAERFVDLIAMSLLALFAATAFPEYRWYVVTLASLILLALPLIHGRPLNRFLDRQRTRTISPWLRELLGQLLRLLQAASDLLKSGPLYGGLILGFVAWGAEGVAFYLILIALDVPTSIALAVGIYSISVLIGAISFIPGGLGSTEAIMVILLKLIGADTPAAIAATLICRLATLWFAVILGGISLALLEIHDKQFRASSKKRIGICS